MREPQLNLGAHFALETEGDYRCAWCKGTFPGSGYSWFADTGKRQTYCNECNRNHVRKWRARDRAHIKKLNKANGLWNSYGMTVAEYDRLNAAQGGVCFTCKRPNSLGRLHVDHCHATGKIRGLLCSGCNTSLGRLRDDATLLRALAVYVETADTGLRCQPNGKAYLFPGLPHTRNPNQPPPLCKNSNST